MTIADIVDGTEPLSGDRRTALRRAFQKAIGARQALADTPEDAWWQSRYKALVEVLEEWTDVPFATITEAIDTDFDPPLTITHISQP